MSSVAIVSPWQHYQLLSLTNSLVPSFRVHFNIWIKQITFAYLLTQCQRLHSGGGCQGYELLHLWVIHEMCTINSLSRYV